MGTLYFSIYTNESMSRLLRFLTRGRWAGDDSVINGAPQFTPALLGALLRHLSAPAFAPWGKAAFEYALAHGQPEILRAVCSVPLAPAAILER